MSVFEEGQSVRIPCTVEPGPTPGEHLVTVSGTTEGQISGFVRDQFLEWQPGSDTGFLRGIIIAADADVVTVQMYGSFFTTAAGKTSVTSDWARDNLQVASA